MKCEFSSQHYREILQLAKDKGYYITGLNHWRDIIRGFPNGPLAKQRTLLIRHDCDFSLEYAQEMALVEIQEGIKSTYHIMLQSPFYNVMEYRNMEIIKYISDLGHEVGYHCDSNNMIKKEYQVLEKITGKKVYSYSRHFPSTSPRLRLVRLFDAMDMDFILLYSVSNLRYLSDSCRNWREGCLCQNIGKYDKMHILIHPCWWMSGTNSRRAAIEKVRQNIRFNLDNNVKAFHDQVPEYLESITNNISTPHH